MTRRSKGLFVGKTRNIARHHKPSAMSISEIIKSFKIGDNVAIIPKGNFKDIPHPRYKGRIGRVIEKRGSAYVVEINVYNAKKKLVVPVRHLELSKN